jgi:hypothetical protein
MNLPSAAPPRISVFVINTFTSYAFPIEVAEIVVSP